MKGAWFMIESIIAGIILISFLAFLAQHNFSFPEEDLTSVAYQTLEGLNRQGILKPNAEAGNFNAINNNIRYFSYNHSVQICTLESCSGSRPSSGNVWVGSYILAGNSVYNPLEVKLYFYR